MAGSFPLLGWISSSGFFGPAKKKATGGGSTIITVNGGGPNSTGPFTTPPLNNGDGTGYYDGSHNGGIAIGGTVPNPPKLNGLTLTTIGWQGAGNGFIVSINSAVAQNFFTNVKIDSGANHLNFPTAAPSYFSSNTDFPGTTVWRWADGHEFSVGLTTYTATFT